MLVLGVMYQRARTRSWSPTRAQAGSLGARELTSIFIPVFILLHFILFYSGFDFSFGFGFNLDFGIYQRARTRS